MVQPLLPHYAPDDMFDLAFREFIDVMDEFLFEEKGSCLEEEVFRRFMLLRRAYVAKTLEQFRQFIDADPELVEALL